MDDHINRLSRDLKDAAYTLSDEEARFLVDAYYIVQEDRKRSGNQVRSMDQEPHLLLAWFFDQNRILEQQVKSALDRYSSSKDIGLWMKSQYGIGPVIAAGLMAHIDIKKAPTVGHIWAFAGLDPTRKWEKGQKRPHNAALKTLCWKIGQSFMKFSNEEACFYGHLYRQRKEFYVKKNEAGDYKEQAAALLPKFKPTTEAHGHLSKGVLPPAQIDARARRWAVKMFLSHMHEVWYELAHGVKPPACFAIAILKHGHYLPPPNWPMTKQS
jgi:Transposase IS116/IS110/IS902 family